MADQIKFKIKTLTASLFFFDILLWCVGLVFLMFGTYAEAVLQPMVKNDIEAKEFLLRYIPTATLFYGISVLIASLVSCSCLFSKTYCSKYLFALVIAIIFALQVIMTVLCLWYQTAVDRSVYNGFNTSLFSFDSGSESDIQVNVAQSKFKCCGLVYYTDWFRTHWARKQSTVPPSCCRDIYRCHNLPPLMTNHIYTRGCQEALQEATEESNKVVISALSIILIAQVVGFSGAIALGTIMKKAQADDKRQQEMQNLAQPPEF